MNNVITLKIMPLIRSDKDYNFYKFGIQTTFIKTEQHQILSA
jgi:hypothetical protein